MLFILQLFANYTLRSDARRNGFAHKALALSNTPRRVVFQKEENSNRMDRIIRIKKKKFIFSYLVYPVHPVNYFFSSN